LVTIIPMISLYIRRLHDIDRHGAYFLLYLIPFAGIIIMFVMLTRPSAPYDVYPGRSGGPYPYPHPYGYGSQPPYGGQASYRQPAPYQQQPYQQQPYQQQAYGGQPYYGGFPQRPRSFAPYAGGNTASAAIALTVIVIVLSAGYNMWASGYYTVQITNLIDDMTSEMTDGGYGNGFLPLPDYEPYVPGYGEDEYGEDDWLDDFGEEEITAEEQAVIDTVKEETLEGFPEFTIEDVLLSRVDEDGLDWDYYDEDFEEGIVGYVTATGFEPESVDLVYADFTLTEDGRILLTNLMIGTRDEYDQRAKELYSNWYRDMLTFGGNGKAA
jgi:hypothetical protein